MFNAKAFEGAITAIALVILLIGIAMGGLVFEVLPWIYHHLSFSWK